MRLKYCARCRADVEDAGGFCLLGHRLPTDGEDALMDLRREVDHAFKKVEVDISRVFEEQINEPIPAPAASVYEQLKSDQAMGDELLESRRTVWRELSDDTPVERNDPILSFSPSPRMEWGRKVGRRRRDDD